MRHELFQDFFGQLADLKGRVLSETVMALLRRILISVQEPLLQYSSAENLFLLEELIAVLENTFSLPAHGAP